MALLGATVQVSASVVLCACNLSTQEGNLEAILGCIVRSCPK